MDYTAEILSGKGDRWVLRPCDEEDDCTVLERWLCKDDCDDPPGEHPTEDIHIPWSVLLVLMHDAKQEASKEPTP